MAETKETKKAPKKPVQGREDRVRCTDLLGEEIMSHPVATVRDEATVREAAKGMVDRGVSGLVVCDHAGKGIGVITASDVVRHQLEHRCSIVPAEDQERLREKAAERVRDGFHLERTDETLVRDAMTPFLLTMPARSPVGVIARQMGERRIHRVLLEREGRIVGIVTALDVARAAGRNAPPAGAQARS